MALIKGNPAYWLETFPEELIPDMLDLVISVWVRLKKPPASTLEVSITRRFLHALKQDKNIRRELPVRITRECVEDDPMTGKEIGRIDMMFIPLGRGIEYVYFAFECKRLNIAYKRGRVSLASKYVMSGMLRFITSQYASRLSQGGMIGYVMDGDLKFARDSVERLIKRHRSKLKMVPPGALADSSLFPKNEQIKETKHGIPKRPFLIHHLFLPLS